MFKTIIRSFMLILGAVLGIPHFSAAQNSPHVPGELLVGPKAGVSDADFENQYKAHGGRKIKTLSQIKVHHIKVPAHALEKIEAALAKNPKVEFVEKNFLAETNFVPNDPGYSTQWHLSKISAPQAWDLNAGSSNVVIAVLDSGVDTNHPDLAPNLVAGRNFLDGSSNVYDNGSNGGHGTAASGTAAASGHNSIGVSGVSWRNSIMPLVVVQDNWATYSNIAAAITYAADHGAKVISMSLAGTSYSSVLESAVNYAWNKGTVLIGSAGNYANNSPTYPGALSNVLAVTGTDQSDSPASFTSFGSWVSVAAPATYIYTTTLGGGYGTWQGTSFATPQVAGLAALLFSANPALTNAQVVNLIEANADDLGAPGFDQYYGHGRINAYRALLGASIAETPPPPPPPPSPPSSTLKAYYVGITGQDMVGAGNQIGPNGNADFQIRTQGLRGNPTRVRVTSDTGGIWENPFNGSNWIILQQYDGAGNADLWFEPWTSNSFRVKVWYSDGTIDETSAVNQTTTVPPPPPSPPSAPPPGDTTPPTVNIVSTQYDGKWLTASVSASDSQTGIAKVEFYSDGKLQATDSSQPYTFRINTKPWPRGSHSIQVKAYDGAGNIGVSVSASLTTR